MFLICLFPRGTLDYTYVKNVAVFRRSIFSVAATLSSCLSFPVIARALVIVGAVRIGALVARLRGRSKCTVSGTAPGAASGGRNPFRPCR